MSETLPEEKPEEAADPADSPPTGRRRSRRLERIRDYQRGSLANPDPLQANLGAVNGDLMRIAYRLIKITDAALARSPDPAEGLAGLLPAVGACSQVTRQIHRFSELSHRLREAQDGGVGLPQTAGPTPADESQTNPPDEEGVVERPCPQSESAARRQDAAGREETGI
jgi:hypothetical protein